MKTALYKTPRGPIYGLAFSILALMATACKSDQPPTKEDLIGTWENISLKVEMSSYQNTDSISYLNVEEGQWENMLKMKPIRTVFKDDNTFTSSYFDLDGQPIGQEEGSWEILNDSLVLKSQSYSSAYHVSMKANRARFVCYLDWDRDGAEDDLYDGWQVKVEE